MTSFIQSFWQVMLALAPWLLLGALIAGGLHVVLPRRFLKRQFSGPWGILKAVGLGVPLPLCSCAVIPVGLGLKQGGASNGATVAFLISTPQTGVDSVLVSASFLGWPFALFKVASAAITGLLGGWWVDRQKLPSLPVLSQEEASKVTSGPRWKALIQHSLELLHSVWRWLLVGAVVSAAIETFMPAGGLSGFAAYGDLPAMFVTLAIAVPLYICATASVPIAAALVASGLPVGAALVFLMAGPATNVATIGAVYRMLGRRALAIYLTTVIVGSIGAGWLFGFLVEGHASGISHLHEQNTWWSIMSAVVLLVLFGWFGIEEARQRTSISR